MKKLLFFVMVLMSVCAKAQISDKKNHFSSFSGGMIISANNSISFMGFVGPKVSVTLNVAKNFKAEVGVNAFPGLVLKPELKPGLALGSTITLKNNNWKLKPVVGVVLIKTKEWQPMLGLGFVF